MNIKQIKYFVSVVEQGSLSAAAKCQHVTVQAVSKAIADLERELGSDLLVRESRGVRPTSFGRAFHRKAEKTLESFEELETFAGGDRPAVSTRVKHDPVRLIMCAPPFEVLRPVGAFLGVFLSDRSGYEVQVDMRMSADALRAVEDGQADGLITLGTCHSADFECVEIGTVNVGVLMAPEHPLTARSSVDLADLAQYPIGNSRLFNDFADSLVAVCVDRCPDLKFVDLEQADDFRRHFHENQGVSLVADLPLFRGSFPSMRIRSLSPQDATSVSLCMAYEKSRVTPQLLAVVRAAARDMSPFTGMPA